MRRAAPLLAPEIIGIELEAQAELRCRQSHLNKECLREHCSLYRPTL